MHFAEEYLSRFQSALEPSSDKLADPLMISGRIFIECGEPQRAKQVLEKAISILEKNKMKKDAELRMENAKMLLEFAHKAKSNAKKENKEAFSEREYFLEKLRAARILNKKGRR